MKLAFLFRNANEKYAADYPAAVGHHMSNTDSSNFMDFVAAISVRENERGMQIGAGWNPHYLGLNAAQTSLAAIAQLAEATVK
jgi:hypothetical protein